VASLMQVDEIGGLNSQFGWRSSAVYEAQ
jgi:hypothetical protein